MVSPTNSQMNFCFVTGVYANRDDFRRVGFSLIREQLDHIIQRPGQDSPRQYFPHSILQPQTLSPYFVISDRPCEVFNLASWVDFFGTRNTSYHQIVSSGDYYCKFKLQITNPFVVPMTIEYAFVRTPGF